MRIAICISGYFSNKNRDNLLLSNYIYDNVIYKCNGNDVDIFIHSFDKQNETNIINKFPNAKCCVVEEQIDFIKILSKENYEYYKKLENQKYFNFGEYNFQSSLSFLYSRCKTIKYALQYSKEHNIVYDCIIRCRMDVGIRQKTPLNGYKPDNLIFNPTLDFSYFYSSYWNQLNAGYCGFWEFSNSENMEIFSNLYDYALNNMLKLNSDYLHNLNNWFDSNKNDFRTNEMLNKKTMTMNNECKREKYNFVHSINNHLIEKFFMYKCGLYYKSRFLDYTNNVEILYEQ